MGYVHISRLITTYSIALVIRYAFNVLTRKRVSSGELLENVKFIVLQAGTATREDYGCLPPPRLANRRPLGVDRMEQLVRADSESRLMQLFLFHFRYWGNTLDHVFLGTRSLATIEPRNLESMLCTNLKGTLCGIRLLVILVLIFYRLGYGSSTSSYVSAVRRWHFYSGRY